LAKLKILSGKEVCALLSRHGFQEVRRRGSHIVMQMSTEGTTVTIPVPDYAELRTGTLASIIRQSKLPRSLFEV
jgi:predicted RNA binding protein YcfA (HicA-like mRNA interferase family)